MRPCPWRPLAQKHALKRWRDPSPSVTSLHQPMFQRHSKCEEIKDNEAAGSLTPRRAAARGGPFRARGVVVSRISRPRTRSADNRCVCAVETGRRSRAVGRLRQKRRRAPCLPRGRNSRSTTGATGIGASSSMLSPLCQIFGAFHLLCHYCASLRHVHKRRRKGRGHVMGEQVPICHRLRARVPADTARVLSFADQTQHQATRGGPCGRL